MNRKNHNLATQMRSFVKKFSFAVVIASLLPVYVIFVSAPVAEAVTVTPSGACSASYTTVSGSPSASILQSEANGNSYCIIVFKSADENSSAVVNWTAPDGVISFQTLLVGGGGSGGAGRGGGGGAGEMAETQIPTDSPNFTLTIGKGGNAVSSGQGITGDSTTVSSSYITRRVRGGGGGGSHSGSHTSVDFGLVGGSGGGSGMNYLSYTDFSGGAAATLGTGLGNKGGDPYLCTQNGVALSFNDQIRVTGGGGGAGSAGVSGGNCGANPGVFMASSCSTTNCYGAVSPAGGSGKESNLLNEVYSSFGYSRNLFAAGGGGALGLSSSEYCGTGFSGQTGTYCSYPSGYSGGDRSSGGPGGSAGLGGAGAGATGSGVAGTASTGSGGGGTATGTSGRGGSGVIAIKYLLPKTTLAAPTVPVSVSQQNATFSSNVVNPSGLTRQKQWEVSPDGINWSSVTGGSGATSDTYTTSTLSVLSNNGKYYRLKFVDSISVDNINLGTSTISTTSYTSPALLTVNKASQAAFSLSTSSGTYLTSLKLSATGGSDTGTVSFAVSSIGIAGCSITNSDSLTSTSAGTCQVVATKAGTPEYFPAYDTQTITLGKASLGLTLTISGSNTVNYGGTTTSSFTTSRTLGTGNVAARSGTISYSATGSVCSIDSSSGAISMNRASGTCLVSVSLSGDSNYSDTSSATVTLTAAKADTLTVTAGSPTLTYNGNSQTIPHSYTISGLKFSDTLTAVSYAYSGTPNSGGSATGSTFVDQAGTYTVTPSSALITNSDSYTAISYATGTLTVNRASRTIAASGVTSLKYGSTASMSATTSPSTNTDGSVSYSVGASNACSITSGTGALTMTRASGTCAVTPTISQGNNYLAATGSAYSVIPATADAISVTATNATATYNGSRVTISPSFSVSGLQFSDTVTVTYQYSGTDNSGASYTLSNLTPINAGTYSIVPVITLSNSDSYTASSNAVNGTLTVDRASRTLAATTYSTNSLKYGAVATVVSNTTTPSTNSDGTFSYAVGTGCSINSTTGALTATSSSSTCSQTTTIGQGNNYLSATSSAQTFALSKADTLTVTSSTPAPVTYTGSAAAISPSVSVTGLVNSDTVAGATYNYSRASTCATGGTCSVGDTGPGGGIVFYVSATAIDAADGISTGGIYLEAAPSSFSKTMYNWCEGITNPYTTTIGGTSSAVGTGALNTKIVSTRCSGGAVYEAANLTFGGKADWFLPSSGEQSEMFNQRTILGFGTGTVASDYLYWGSNETENWVASSLVPANGVGGQNKGQATPYWPIRAFSPTATTYSSSPTPPTNAGTYVITPSSLTLSGGASVDNYVAVVYETSTVTINKANQSIFSNYGSLEAILGNAFQIYPFGGSGDGAVFLAIANGTATGCSAGLAAVTAATEGTCILTITKSANENYNSAQTSFSIRFIYFVPAAAAPISSRPSEIALATSTPWSATASAAPSITSFSPNSGPVGTLVTISGVGLDGVNSVKIGRKAMTSVTGVSSTSVTAVIPAGAASGPIVVTNSAGSDFSSSNFTVTP